MTNSFYHHILEPIAKAIAHHSTRNAFFIAGKAHSYEEFAGRIAAVRTAIATNPGKNQVWGLALHDDLDTYASIIALWMEGKAYVPLHSAQPLERNLGIIAQVELDRIIDTAEDSVFGDFSIINPSGLPSATFRKDFFSVDDNELAYILFTSGSTGIPKGVSISRRNIASFMDAFWQTGINITSQDHCLQCFDLTFDVSVQSYLCALTQGACVYTVPYGRVKYIYTASLISNQHITFGAMAPSMLTYLHPYFAELDFSSLRQCILTAEACPVSMLEDLYQVAPNLELFDFYGPTEATIYCTYYKLSRTRANKSHNGIISIGRPLRGMKGIIINNNGIELGVGEKGELIISGPQLSPGYWKNEERNALSFFEYKEERFYHTGDLCYKDIDGDIMYCGRIDQQAKIQGYRVELGEIEHNARLFYNQAIRVVAIAYKNPKTLTEIVLFIETETNNFNALDEYLRSKMPQYMIPSRYISVPSFPLNKSEKIDKVALIKLLDNE